MLIGVLCLISVLGLFTVLGLGLFSTHGAFGWAAAIGTALVLGACHVHLSVQGFRIRRAARARGLPEWVGFQSIKFIRRVRPFLFMGWASLAVVAALGLAVDPASCPAWVHGLSAGLAVGLNLGTLFVAWASTIAQGRLWRSLRDTRSLSP